VEKPLLLFTTDESKNSSQNRRLDTESNLLDTKTINADHCLDDTDWAWLSQKPIAKYSGYRNQVIKKTARLK
jgi:hypothetical protein